MTQDISSKDRESAAILSRFGLFIETGLKLMSEVQTKFEDLEATTQNLDNLHLVLVAAS